MPSASLQSRISAFENPEASNNGHPRSNGGVRLTPLTLPRKPVQPHILDSDSTSPTANSLGFIPPIQPVPQSSRPSSPAALGRKSSLIDFSELVSPKRKPVATDGTWSTVSPTSSTSLSEPCGRSPFPPRTTPQVPPLPPRKPSIMSLKTTTPTTTPPLPKRHVSSPAPSSIPKLSGNSSLLNPPDRHTYPPASPRRRASPGFQSRHMPSSSTSSFHSVSLSSDGGDTHDSLDGSYEAVSSTAATCCTTSTRHDWEHGLQPNPNAPQRQWRNLSTTSPVSELVNTPVLSPPPSLATRRPPPPPPQRQTVQRTSLAAGAAHHRAAPPPPNAKKRYDALFERNLPPPPHKGRASGWRGLSVDLLTNGEKPNSAEDSLCEERLEGGLVRCIWCCSGLPRVRLREIWNECDPNGIGSLDRDAFAKGMWRIDEALRFAHSHSQKQVRPLFPEPNPALYTTRAPPPPLRKPNFLLR